MAAFKVVWLLSLVLLFLYSIYDAYRDLYFWDEKIKESVRRVYKNWHVVKAISLVFLIVSIFLLYLSMWMLGGGVWKLLGYFLFRYGAFELSMNLLATNYDKGFMRLTKGWAILVMLIGSLMGVLV